MSSLDYLLSFQKFGIKLGLENVAHLLERLGNPHHEFPAIHVAGTNGKGSVVAFVHSALVAMGYRVGRFTSPHLIGFSERIVIGSDPIEDAQLDALIERLRPAVDEMKEDPLYGHPTFFEAVTAIAFLHFALERVDLAVVEVGMGGRYDSTNVVRPCVTVINNVHIEHRDYLGDTLAEIAVEKAGIIKPGIELVSAAQEADARDVIEARVGECNAKAYFLSTDFHVDVRRDKFPRQWVDFTGPWNRLEDVEINLPGSFQARNVAVALMALEILQKKGIVARDEAALRKGMAGTSWPGRIEKLSDSPLIILDSAHNPAAMAALVESMLDLFPNRRIMPVVGMLKDKDVAESLRNLRKLGDTIVVSQPEYERAMSSNELAAAAQGIFHTVMPEKKIASAIEQALALVQQEDIVLITGSLFNVAEVKAFMAQRDASSSQA
jgi:dihydrofolate synthase/folylpolyglutamate synthase